MRRERERNRAGSLTNSSKTFRCNSAVITGEHTYGERERERGGARKLKKKKEEEKWERKVLLCGRKVSLPAKGKGGDD